MPVILRPIVQYAYEAASTIRRLKKYFAKLFFNFLLIKFQVFSVMRSSHALLMIAVTVFPCGFYALMSFASCKPYWKCAPK